MSKLTIAFVLSILLIQNVFAGGYRPKPTINKVYNVEAQKQCYLPIDQVLETKQKPITKEWFLSKKYYTPLFFMILGMVEPYEFKKSVAAPGAKLQAPEKRRYLAEFNKTEYALEHRLARLIFLYENEQKEYLGVSIKDHKFYSDILQKRIDDLHTTISFYRSPSFLYNSIADELTLKREYSCLTSSDAKKVDFVMKEALKAKNIVCNRVLGRGIDIDLFSWLNENQLKFFIIGNYSRWGFNVKKFGRMKGDEDTIFTNISVPNGMNRVEAINSAFSYMGINSLEYGYDFFKKDRKETAWTFLNLAQKDTGVSKELCPNRRILTLNNQTIKHYNKNDRFVHAGSSFRKNWDYPAECTEKIQAAKKVYPEFNEYPLYRSAKYYIVPKGTLKSHLRKVLLSLNFSCVEVEKYLSTRDKYFINNENDVLLNVWFDGDLSSKKNKRFFISKILIYRDYDNQNKTSEFIEVRTGPERLHIYGDIDISKMQSENYWKFVEMPDLMSTEIKEVD